MHSSEQGRRCNGTRNARPAVSRNECGVVTILGGAASLSDASSIERHKMKQRGLPWALIAGVMTAVAVTLFAVTHRFKSHAGMSDGHVRPRAATAARIVFEQQLDSLARRLAVLDTSLAQHSPAPQRAAFRAARAAYRRAECLLAVYGPTFAAELNGPLPETSEDLPAGPLGAPAGFQILEAVLF